MNKNKLYSIIFILFLLVSIAVLFFSWTSSPALTNVRWLPRWIATWADKEENMNSRTAIPMFLWGIVAGVTFSRSKSISVVMIISLLIGISLLMLAEGIQYYLPYRHADWGDIYWGTIGLTGGLIVFALGKWLFKK
jgi:glycopeptide antibiotics resistance protein